MSVVIEPMEPLTKIDWDKVGHIKVTLEKPFKNGGLRWRQGTTSPQRNLNFNANDKKSGPVYWPGVPIMYPEAAPAVAGDPERDSFIMSADMSAQMMARREEGRMGPAPNPTMQAAFIAFGYFMAPLTDEDGIVGFTQSSERTRVAAFWNWFKMPPGDGTMNPPMNRIAAPDIPQVALRPLNKNLQPLKIKGEEVVIRPFQFWKFDDATMYDAVSGQVPADVSSMLSGFTLEEIEGLRELVKAKRANGK